MATTSRRWTRADLDTLPDDGNRYEVLGGALLVTPMPSFPHEWIVARLLQVLVPYVARHRLGMVATRGAVVIGKEELGPDVLVVPVTGPPIPEKWEHAPRPLLVAEVLSRTTRSRDLGVKREAYLERAIPVYWVIDRFERRALVWRPPVSEPEIVEAELRWQPRADVPTLVIPLAEVLPPVGESAPSDAEE